MFGLFSEDKKLIADAEKLKSILDATLRKWENSSYEDISRQIVEMFPEKYRNLASNKLGFVFPDFPEFQFEISFSEIGKVTGIDVTGRGNYMGAMIFFMEGKFSGSVWNGLAYRATKKSKKLIAYMSEKYGFRVEPEPRL